MDNPIEHETSDATPAGSPRHQWQYSLAALMIAMSAVCVLVSPNFRFLIDRRSMPFLVVAAIMRLTKGQATRGAAVGGIAGICLGMCGLDRHWWGWNELADQSFTVLAVGAMGAWFGAAFHAAKRGYQSGLAALIALFVWFLYSLYGRMP